MISKIFKKIIPSLSKPTKEEIEKTHRMVMIKYDIDLSLENASRFANLVKELNWWINLKDDPISKKRIVDEILVECKNIYHKKYKRDITDLEANNCAKTLLDESIMIEKERIKSELDSIILSDDNRSE